MVVMIANLAMSPIDQREILYKLKPMKIALAHGINIVLSAVGRRECEQYVRHHGERG